MNVVSSSDTVCDAPYSDEEDDRQVEVRGRNNIDIHLFSGWGNIWKPPTTVDKKFLIKELSLEELPAKYDLFRWDNTNQCLVSKSTGKPRHTLKELSDRTSCGQINVPEPLSLWVIEKRCVSLTASGFILAKILVADQTGVCNFVMFNDTIISVFTQVEVGDAIIGTGLGFARYQSKSEISFGENPTLRCEFLLPAEVKVPLFGFRNIVVIKNVPFTSVLSKLYLEKGIWIPSELWQPEEALFRVPLQYNTVDIGGVVNYVSCIMRARKKRTDLTGNEDTDFFCFRWIQLVDKNLSRPLTTKLYLNNLNWDAQENIVPGVLVVLTNMAPTNHEENPLEFYLESTWYTKVHINKEVALQYLQPRPKEYRPTLRSVSAIKHENAIMANPDITWSVGGFPTLCIANADVLQNAVMKNSHEEFVIPKLERREVTSVFGKGYIYRVFRIIYDEENNLHYKLFWSDGTFPNLGYYKRNGEDRIINTVLPGNKTGWFAYRRKFLDPLLGSKEDLLLEHKGMFAVYNKNRDRNKKICRPLLMPSKSDNDAECELKDLPLASKKLFLICLADPSKKLLLSCLWNWADSELMENRLKEYKVGVRVPPEENATSKQKETGRCDLNYIVNLHQIETKHTRAETNIHVDFVDFVPALPTMYNPTLDSQMDQS